MLSKTETKVVWLVGEGMTNATIAQLLGISKNTVEQHLSNIKHKVDIPNGVHNRVWLAMHVKELV